MSSSDAIAHGGSVSLDRDVILPFKPDMAERTEVWIMRVGVVAIGAAAYWLSIFGAAGIIGLLCNIVVFVAVSLMTRPVAEALADEYANA